jgi:hypothetical protein
MRSLSISWPKLLGSILLIGSTGSILLQAYFWWYRSGPDQGPIAAWEWWRLIVALLFSFVSYCVYRGRDWARLTVIVLGICLGGLIFWQVASDVIYVVGRHDESTSTRSFLMWQFVDIANTLGLGLVQFLAPLAFVIGVFCHRDVAAAFRPAVTERSNQSLEPTAGRLDDQI